MYLKHFSVQQLPQDCESSFKLDRIKTMEQSNSLDITTKMLAAEAAATLTTGLSQCSGHFTLD